MPRQINTTLIAANQLIKELGYNNITLVEDVHFYFDGISVNPQNNRNKRKVVTIATYNLSLDFTFRDFIDKHEGKHIVLYPFPNGNLIEKFRIRASVLDYYEPEPIFDKKTEELLDFYEYLLHIADPQQTALESVRKFLESKK
jgi:hypothetical protein